MILDYPTEFPGEAVTLVLDKVMGKEPPTAELVRAGWHVMGFALGKTLAGGPQPSWGEDSNWTDQELLEAAQADSLADPEAKGAIPWLLIVRLALKLIQEYSN